MIKLEDYRARVTPIITQWCSDRPEKTPGQHISQLALYLPCPCLAVCHFMVEIYGQDPDLMRILDVLNRFYKEEVIGIRVK